MDNDLLLFILIFLGIFAITFGGYLFLARRRMGRVNQRVQQKSATGSDPSIGSTPELVLGDLTPALAQQVPMGQENQQELQRELRTAGYYRPTALMEYAALRAILIIAPLVIGAVVALFVETMNQAMWAWGLGVLGAILGFSIPRVYIYFRAQARMRAIERGLPVAIDMLTLCLGAGLNVLNSLQRVTQELYLAFPVLAEELEIVRRQADLRTLEFALAQFADRVGLPSVRNIAVILNQSENLGTDAVSVLREYADNMRINMRQRADEMANKAPFKLLFPAYMLAVGAGILLVSPTVLEFASFWQNNSNLVRNSMRDAREALNAPAAPQPIP